MIKNIIFYLAAAALFVFSILSYNSAYKEMQNYSLLTQRSVKVFTTFQELSRQISNAAVITPALVRAEYRHPGTDLFITDSITIVRLLDKLNKAVLDSINTNLAYEVNKLLSPEISWLMRSNVPDSILHSNSEKHLITLRRIDSLIKEGMLRTDYLFNYREQKLTDSIKEVQTKIILFFILACALVAFTTINLLHQQARRREKEKELDTQSKKFRAMIENSHDLIVMLDEKQNVVYRSPSSVRITGYTKEDIEHPSLKDIYPDDQEKIQNYIKKMQQDPGKAVAASYRLRHKAGHYIWLEGTFTSMFHDPDLKSIVINVKDVSEHKIAEEGLKKTEQRFRQTLDNMMEGVQIIGSDWRYIYVNEALTRYSGYDRDQMLGKKISDLYPGVEQTKLYNVLKNCMLNGTSQQLENEFVFPDGTKKFFELSVQPAPEGVFILSVDISERKKAEEELKKSIKEVSDFKYALEESAIVAVTDQKGIIRHVNENFCKIAKYSAEELLGQDHRIINSGFHSKEFIRNLWLTISGGKIWQGELKNKAKDGSIYWVSTTIVPFLDEQGKPYQYTAIRYDITERKKAEKEIIKLNRLYAFISSINQSIVHITDETELFRKACDIAVETGNFILARIDLISDSGYLKTVSIKGVQEGIQEKATLKDLDFSLPVAKDTPAGITLSTGNYAVNNDLLGDPALLKVREVLEQSNSRSGISLPIRRGGKMVGIFNLTSSQPGFFDHREINLLLEAAGDISFALDVFEKNRQHQLAEQKVENNERRFRALIEKSTDLKTLTNSEGFFVYASPSITKVFGYTEEDFLNKPAYEFFHPEDIPDLLLKRNELLAIPGSSFDFQYRVRHKTGKWMWCEGSLTNMLHEPAINALVSNFKDISEKKKAEEQQEFDRNNLDALINNTDDLLWSIDKEFRLITFNQAFFEACKMRTGVELAKGHNVLSASLSQENTERFKSYYLRALGGEAFSVVETEEGRSEYALEISFYPMRLGTEIIGTACYSRDITLRIRQEREREKMITDLTRYTKNLEQFAYVVSHNLRSPVANIIGLSNLVNSGLSEKDKQRSQEHMLKAVHQLDTVVKDLNGILELRASPGQNLENVQLKEIVLGLEESISEILEQEKVTLDYNFEIEHLRGVRSYIFSIFYNLVSNSIKYRHPARNPRIRITSRLEKDKIILSFTDNGLGIDLTQHGNKVFGLYQRFHMEVDGKGMGLFMVRTHVEAMKGSVSLESTPGEGSTFRIELPFEKQIF